MEEEIKPEGKNMKPNKVRIGGEGCIIIASFGTFQHRHKYT